MARPTREKLKRTGLVVFVAIGVVLAGLTWADNISDRSQTRPGFYRPTSSIPTVAAPRVTSTPPTVATPSPATHTPGPSPTPFPTIED